MSSVYTTTSGHTTIFFLVYHGVPFGIPNWYSMVYQNIKLRSATGSRKAFWYTKIFYYTKWYTKWYCLVQSHTGFGTWYTIGIPRMVGIPMVYQNGTTWYTKWYDMVYQMVQHGIPNGTAWYTKWYTKWYTNGMLCMDGYASKPPAAGPPRLYTPTTSSSSCCPQRCCC